MIINFTNYYDQTQSIGLVPILDYHGIPVEIPYPLLIALSQSVEYGINLSRSTEHGIAIEKEIGYEYGIIIGKETEYDIATEKEIEYNIDLSKTGGGSI